MNKRFPATLRRSILICPLLIAALLASRVATAAESDGITGYKLNTDTSSPYRLATSHTPPPLLPPQVEPPAASHLADRPYANLIEAAARAALIEPELVHAVISVESGYNNSAVSPKGAIGLMQVLPATAMRYGVRDPARSPEANLRAGTQYLKDLMAMFGNRLDLVLAAYNAGENAVIRYGTQIPPFRETQQYVPAVLAVYRKLQPPPLATPTPPTERQEIKRIQYMPGTWLQRVHAE